MIRVLFSPRQDGFISGTWCGRRVGQMKRLAARIAGGSQNPNRKIFRSPANIKPFFRKFFGEIRRLFSNGRAARIHVMHMRNSNLE
jgi:hypothetical protein